MKREQGPASRTSPHSGHRARLRQRLSVDPLSVADYELLELLLGYGLTRRDTKPLAKELLARFTSLRGVLDARPDELLDVPGFGPGLLHLWRVLRETLARYMEGPVRQREVAANPESIARMAQARLAGRTEEEVWVALLTQANALIAWERLRQGSIDHVPILPRDVFAIALQRKASGIILVHNHPGGNTTPSQPDLTLTGVLRQQALPLGLRLLDHIIVTDGACYSILQSRYLRSDTDPAT